MVAVPVLRRNLMICSERRLIDSDISKRFYSANHEKMEKQSAFLINISGFAYIILIDLIIYTV